MSFQTTPRSAPTAGPHNRPRDKAANADILPEPDHVFWSRQASEKSIKAALTYAGRVFDLSHRLDDLATLLPDGWAVRRVSGHLGRLTEYAVDTRYPDARHDATANDATQAVSQAGAIVNAIRKDLTARGLALPGTPSTPRASGPPAGDTP